MKFTKSIHYVPSAIDAIEFYENAFGFNIEFIHESKNYAELNTGETILGFATHEAALGNIVDKDQKEFLHTELQFITNNVQSSFEKAVNAGATPLKEPSQIPSGQTTALLRAIDGSLIELCTPPN